VNSVTKGNHTYEGIDLPKRVLVLVGPTASGKTTISLLLAQQINAEIISADSRQIYRYMDVGTAKPSKDERSKVRHYFVDQLNPNQDFNAGEFSRLGRQIIDDIFFWKKIPLVVGGSGLYVQALIDGFFEGPSADTSIRKQLYQRLTTEGREALYGELKKIDPVAASRMIPSNTRRIVRALEVYQLTGTPISHLQQYRVPANYAAAFIGLNWDRNKLYDRINCRVDWMIAAGLVDEVRKLKELGYSSDLNALQTVGYKEVFDYLNGKYSHERMVELIKQNSRRFAKRQLTWFRKDKRIRWYQVQDEKDLPRIASCIRDDFKLR
jgi:tRNA dimethylallyltransferase